MLKRLLLSFVLLAAVVPVSATAAQAACTESTHCYGIVQYFPSRFDMGEISGTLRSGTIKAVGAGPRVNQEAWAGLGGCANAYSCWVEQGIKIGGAPDQTIYTSPIWFYEYISSLDPGNVHFTRTSLSVATNTDYSWKMHYHGSNTWYVSRGSTTYTINAAGVAIRSDAGTEITDSNNTSCGTQNNLGYIASGSTTNHVGWADAVDHPTLRQDSPITGSVSNYTNLTFRANC